MNITKMLMAILTLLTVAEAKNPAPDLVVGTGYVVKSYQDAANTQISYLDHTSSEVKIQFSGQKWSLRYKVPKKDQKAAIAKMVEALKAKGATRLYDNPRKERIFLQLQDAVEHSDYYIEILYGWSDHYRLFLYKERFLQAEQSQIITFDTKATGIESLTYRARFDGKHFYTMQFEVLEGEGADVTVSPYLEDEAVRIRHKAELRCESRYYKQYHMYDLAQYAGTYNIKVKPLAAKTKVKLTLHQTPYTIPSLGQLSTKPAVIKMQNTLSALPTLSAVGYISGNYTIQGDYLPNGDAIYWLNNGYYTLQKDGLQSNLIPARADYMTTIAWPLFYNAMEQYSTQQAEAVTTQMAVYDVTQKRDQVTVDLSLSHLPKGMTLAKEDFSVLEAGTIKGEVRSIERLHEPMHIVILLDSSGSMKRSMRTASQSVETFIQKLPKDAEVTLVDFDTKVKVIKAKSRASLLSQLRKIKANGATALYDSLIKGVDLLKGKSRASVILFTDGKDANYNDTKRGSKATFEQMIQEVQAAKIPIYPIAFGKGADTTSLQTIAAMTKTTYYQGDNADKLAKIFEDIRQTLASSYRLLYQRGRVPKEGSQPVVNYMIDTSGSQDLRYTMTKSCEGCGYRYEQLKAMLAQSIEALPEDTYIQLSSFASEVKTLQTITTDKAKLLAGVGALKIGGGTKILKAVQRGLALSQVIPSNRRYFIFVTDAADDAFEFGQEEEKALKAALLAFKRSGIQTFWLGMVENPNAKKEVEKLASISGGSAYVSADIEKIKDKILALTQKVHEQTTTQTQTGTVSIKLKKRDEKSGSIVVAVGEKGVDFPLLQGEQNRQRLLGVSDTMHPFDTNKESYSVANAQTIYGQDIPLKEVRLEKKIPLLDDQNRSIRGENNAIEMTLSTAYLFERLKGISSGSHHRFLLLDMQLSNHLPSQKVAVLEDGSKHPSSWLNHSNAQQHYKEAVPTYKIPNLQNHLFIRVNDAHEIPFSPLTWALEKPLVGIDEVELRVDDQAPKAGVVAFNIPNEPIKSLSLHYYDTAYGHIEIPIIGRLTPRDQKVEALPKAAPQKLGDAFALSVVSRGFVPQLLGIKAGQESLFETVTLTLESRLNALLALDPNKRFVLKVKTPQGAWYIAPHPITAKIPLGLYDQISLAPGSKNRFALAFEIPKALKDLPQSLVVELKGEDQEIILSKGSAKQSKAVPPLAEASGDKIALALNHLYTTTHIDGRRHKALLADVTLRDDEDLFATRLHHFMALSDDPTFNPKGRASKAMGNQATHKGLGGFSNSSKETKGSKKFIWPNAMTKTRLLGCSDVVLDGAQKRCLLLFDIDKVSTKKPLYLLSSVFTDLKYKIDPKKLTPLPKAEGYLLSQVTQIKEAQGASEIERLLKKVRQAKIDKAKDTKQKRKRKVSLEAGKELAQEIAPLPMSYHGSLKIAKINTLKAALEALRGVRWVPAYHERSLYSPEAMFTQGWGTEYEMIAYLHRLLRAQNIPIQTGYYRVTPKGKSVLDRLAGGVDVTHQKVPYIAWEEGGVKESIVLPFMQPAKALQEELDPSSLLVRSVVGSASAQIKITLWYEKAKESAAAQMGGMGSALSGSSGSKMKKMTLLQYSQALTDLSNMPLDIWFTKGKNAKGKEVIWTCYLGKEGVESKEVPIDAKSIPQKLEITLYDGTRYLDPYHFAFKEGQGITDLFFTFAFGAPDLPEKVLQEMERVRQESFGEVKNLEPLSQLQWTNRAKIYRFLSLQSSYEATLAKQLQLEAKRNRTPRTLMAMIEKQSDGTLVSSLDLRSVSSDLYGKVENQKTFNLMGGLLATETEGASVAKSMTVTKLWESAKNLTLLTLLPKKKKEALALMKQRNIPTWILERLKGSKRVWLFPKEAIHGRYGWLEIDPKDFTLISVMDNGQYSAMTETVITQENIETTTRYFLGLLIGGNIAVGSVINYALLGYESSEEIKKRAQKLAKVLGCYVKKFETVSGDVIGTAKGAAKDELQNQAKGNGGDAIENMIESTFSCEDGGESEEEEEPKAYKDYINFGKGIDHAIALYFKTME